MSKDHAEQDSMGASPKYAPLDQAGLEVLEPSEAPEVVHYASYDSKSYLSRRSSLLKPEVLSPASRYSDNGKGDGENGENAPEHYNLAEGKIPVAGTKVAHVEVESGSEGSGRHNEKRYCCGLRRRGMIILIVSIVLVVVIVGAVVGGVLGSLLGKDNSSSDVSLPLQTFPNTGLASTIAADDAGHLLTYFQDPEGRILENSYYQSTWTLTNRTNINSSVVTTAATPGSPLAAVSYSLNGTAYRQVFWVSATGSIMSANSSETIAGTEISTAWSVGAVISGNDAAASNSIGLAACSSVEVFNGIRVYYPDQYGYAQELKYTFGGDGWSQGIYWHAADVQSGLACAVKEGTINPYLNLYMRMKKTGMVQQWWNQYDTKGWFQADGLVSWANHTIAPGSDIAVSSDSDQTEYVYYQEASGTIARGILNPTAAHYQSFDNYPVGAAVGTKLTAAFADGGSVVMYQNRTSDSSIWIDNVSRYGVTITHAVVP